MEHNYRLVAKRFGATCHVRPLDSPDYPYQQLIDLLVADDYAGWVMLEDGKIPTDPVAELAKQAKLFKVMVEKARAKL